MTNYKMAELIGIILGDGSINIYPKINHYRLKISLNSNDDKEYSKYINMLIKDLFKENPIIKKRPDENTLDIFIFKREIIRKLLKMGLVKSPKKNHAIIPEQFVRSKLGNYVLRGYFDTDGSVVLANNNGILYPRLEMKICPSPMQSQLIGLLDHTGIKYKIYNTIRGWVRMQINGKKETKKWKEVIGFSNPKHLNKLKTISL